MINQLREHNKFRNHYETSSIMFYVNHPQTHRTWIKNIQVAFCGFFEESYSVSQEKRTWTLNASFYTFDNWSDCLSVWLVVWLRHVRLVCLFATACLPVIAAGSEWAGREPPAREARFKSSATSAQPVRHSPAGSPKTSGPTPNWEHLWSYRGKYKRVYCALPFYLLVKCENELYC